MTDLMNPTDQPDEGIPAPEEGTTAIPQDDAAEPEPTTVLGSELTPSEDGETPDEPEPPVDDDGEEPI